MDKPIQIFIADLNHEGHNIKTFPYGAGCVASYAMDFFGDAISIELFKSPAALSKACIDKAPHIVGFSNYIWNRYISSELIDEIKYRFPDTIIVVGGPAYPEDKESQIVFLKENPNIDFYIYKEGEIPFVEFLKALQDYDFNSQRLRSDEKVITGCHYLHSGKFVDGGCADKIRDLDAIPSPYLSGIMDKFFDEGLGLLMQTTRGCPFTCTYCSEGLSYYSRLGRISTKRFAAELEYIANRVHNSPTLYLADANFGMFDHDIEICKEIIKSKEKFGWPDKINASTGKNKIDNILKCTRMLKGALRLGAAIQSADEQVLTNIRRSNISTNTILEIGKRVKELGQTSYAEIILGLPGDSVRSHLDSIRHVVDAEISRVQMYPLLLIPGTQMEQRESRDKFGIKTKFRILPRCFSHYEFAGNRHATAEIVEMVIENNTMSFEDYVYCKGFQLTVELFYNDCYFQEIQGLLKQMDLSMFDFLLEAHKLMPTFPGDIKSLYEGLSQMIVSELWDSKEDLEKYVKTGDNLTKYANDEYKNSLATNRAIAVFSCADSLHEVARKAVHSLLEKKGKDSDLLKDYVDEALRFSLLRKGRLLDSELINKNEFSYDFISLAKNDFQVDPSSCKLSAPNQILFYHDKSTAREIQHLFKSFDNPVMGMRNILFHSTVAKASDYFRSFRWKSE